MRKPTPALVISVIALFVALGGAGMAATGGNFILGKSNSATSTTSLSAPTGGKALQVSNTSTTAGATPLGLFAAAGHPPFTVNTQTKVANLNADKLDGIDSSGFVKGRGTFLANRLVFVPTNTKKLLTIPGLGYLSADCFPNTTQVSWHNDTGGNVDMWYDHNGFIGQVVPSGFDFLIVSRANNQPGTTLALGVGNDPNARRTAVLHVFAYQGGDGAPCGFQAQGTLWTSP